MPSGSKIPASVFDPTVAWSTWTPTWASLTVGNGTTTARFMRIGQLIVYRIKFVLGSTSAVGTNPSFTLPVTALAGYVADDSFGVGQANKLSTSTTTVQILYSGGSVARFSPVTATTPITFASGDSIQANGFYEAA